MTKKRREINAPVHHLLSLEETKNISLSTKRPKEIYIAALNLSGLWSQTPIKAKYNDECEWWEDRSGDLLVNKIGLDHKENGIITFGSVSQKEVQIWIDGILASFKMMKEWMR